MNISSVNFANQKTTGKGPAEEMSAIMATTLQFINTTSGHIFLTGKAGTGKTTFLKNLIHKTHKQFAIVAPTGIAALNAGGVTIHSQFLLPLGMFLPDRSLPDGFYSSENVYTQNTLARKHPLNSMRKQVLRAIDLLVIDEVSMLRADLLDAIDYRLKAARGNFKQNFGGVQLLLIGDLHQLPPIVKQEELNLMQRYYPSAWFYESQAIKQSGFSYIELDKIFRQQEYRFINLLNNLRNNTHTQEDIEELNKHFRTQQEIDGMREVITLTTHNNKAENINTIELKKLSTPSFFFEASIEGDFPESIFPVQQRIELKEGAQIMFTRNDNEEGKYFNGKLATVMHIANADVDVQIAGAQGLFRLRKELWENKKYRLNDATKELEDDIVGTFEQFPIKLAWAITVHKSQGLTFDKAIIDVGSAFADGQVYVALSRLRTLDGLILRSPINPNVISTSEEIVSFDQKNNQPEQLPLAMKNQQAGFIAQLIGNTFSFEALSKEIEYAIRTRKEKESMGEVTMKPVLAQINNTLAGEKENTEKFRSQLLGLVKGQDHARLIERLKKGSAYYRVFLWEIVEVLLRHIQEMRTRKRVKTYLNSLEDLDQLFSKKLEEVDKSVYLIECIINQSATYDFSHLSQQRKAEREKLLLEIRKSAPDGPTREKERKKKGEKKMNERSTYDITLQMFESGQNIETIARERGLVVATIEGHLAKAVDAGRIDIFRWVKKEEVAAISKGMQDLPQGFTAKDLFAKCKGKYSYGRLRAVTSYLERTREIPSSP